LLQDLIADNNIAKTYAEF